VHIKMAEEIILPPPSAQHPIPSLTAALRLDNQEQLVELLQTAEHPMLVFGSESLRTLVLRQILADPNNRQPKKKLDMWNQFTSLPKGLVFNSTEVLSDGPLETGPASSIFYLLQASNPAQTQMVAQKIKEHSKLDHKIVFIPQATAMITKLLSDWGISSMPNVSVHRLHCNYLFPIDTDIYSSEYKDALWESAVQGTPSFIINHVAKSILQLQQVVGPIPRIQSYGPMGEEILRKLFNLTVDDYFFQSSQGGSEQDTPTDVTGGQVTALIIMDRKVDSVTPMLTPLTYEGLLDHVLGLDCGFVHVTADLIEDKDDDSAKKAASKRDDEKKVDGTSPVLALGLNSADSLYAEVRNQHVEQFGSFLQNQAKALQESHAKFTSTGKKKDLQEIHQFVKNIPVFTQNLKSLTTHIHLAELVKKTTEDMEFREQWQLERSILEGESAFDQLEELVAVQYPPWRFLRLLCLQSLCSGGIKSSRYDSIRRDVVQTYGYEFLFVLQHLEKAGLLSRREGLWMDTASPFASLRSKLHLIHAEVDTVDPDDISYVSSGYAPISVRIIQTAMKGWQGREEVLKDLPGRLVDVVQKSPPEDLAAALNRPRPSEPLEKLAELGPVTSKKPVLVVYYVGGVTHMEIAALRFLSKRPTFPYHIICCTTKIINGDTLLQSLAQ
jgi:vacuolar protein sorting-associated protein 33A